MKIVRTRLAAIGSFLFNTAAQQKLELPFANPVLFSFKQKVVPLLEYHPHNIMAAPQHLLTSTSSALPEDDACPSTLRARLRDDATPATSSSIDPIPYRNVYEQVHECLGSQLLAPKPGKVVPPVVKSHDPATQLRGWFTTQGLENHTLMRRRGVCSYGNVTSYLCD